MACSKRYVDGISTRQGGKWTGAYSSWKRMKCRCQYVRSDNAKYLEKEHEERLLNDFDYFYEILGPRPEGATLDRIDNNRGYWADNIRWADWHTQCNNK